MSLTDRITLFDKQDMSSTARLDNLQDFVSDQFSPRNFISWFHGDRLSLLRQVPSGTARLCVTSPPYNIGKTYEEKLEFPIYLERQRETIEECVRILAKNGSLCWQVGNHVREAEIFPLDVFIYNIAKDFGLKLRNRVIWCFEHGLNSSNRLSGRYETILWFTKSDNYVFNLRIRYESRKNTPGKGISRAQR